MADSYVHSMTGFASAEGETSRGKIRLEMKTLNHRFLDIKLRLSRAFQPIELPLRSFLQSKITRGSLELRLELSDQTDESSTPALNESIAEKYYHALEKLRKSLGIQTQTSLAELIRMPEVLPSQNGDTTTISSDSLWKEVEPLVQNALGQLTQMRIHEGTQLTRTLLLSISMLKKATQTLKKKRTENQSQYQEKIKSKIEALWKNYNLDSFSEKALLETRVAQELSLVLDRTDIEEELTRLTKHLDHFESTLQKGGPVGKKLDFLLQEINREINTLGNKAQDYLMSEEVVEMKVRTEQLREQVMNLE